MKLIQNMAICCPLERWYAVPLSNFLAFFPAETFRHVDLQIVCDIVVQFLGLRVSAEVVCLERAEQFFAGRQDEVLGGR